MTITITYFITLLLMSLSIIYTIYIKNIVNPIFVFVIPTCLAYVLYFLYFQSSWIISNESNIIFLIGGGR